MRLAGEELIEAGEAELQKVRGARVAMVFQDPISSLNPVYRVGAQIVEAIRAHRARSARARRASWRSRCSTRSGSPTRSAASTTTRTNSPAACASGR